MITIIKLITNIEIIGKVIDENKSVIVVENPLQINYKQKNEFSPPVTFLYRYIPFSSAREITFKQDHIVNKVAPLPGMINYYMVSLKSIENNIDVSVNENLALIGLEPDATKEMTSENEAMLAMLERELTKQTLN